MSGIFKNILGQESRAEEIGSEFSPAGFSTSGFRGTFDERSNSFGLQRTGRVNNALRDITSGFRRRGEELRGLRDEFTDSVTGLTRSRINRLRSNRDRSVGNIRSELNKRRVLGSRFGQSTVAGAEAEFALAEDQIENEGRLTELGVERDLIVQETQAAIDAGATLVNQFNLEAGLVANLTANATNALQANNTAMMEAAAAADAGTAEFLGTIIGAFAPTPTV